MPIKKPKPRPTVGISSSKPVSRDAQSSRKVMVGKAKDAHNRRRRRMGGQ